MNLADIINCQIEELREEIEQGDKQKVKIIHSNTFADRPNVVRVIERVYEGETDD